MRTVTPAANLPQASSRPVTKASPSALPSAKESGDNEPWYGWRTLWQRFSSMIFSATVHALLLTLLAFIAVRDRGEKKEGLVVNAGKAEENADKLDLPTFQVTASEAPSSESKSIAAASLAENLAIQSPSVESTSTADALVANMLGAGIKPPKIDRYEGMVTAFAPWKPAFAKSSLDGRSPQNRMKLALSLGGSEKSEKAVEAALAWLAKHQHRDGGWSTHLNDPSGPCMGACSHGSIEVLDGKRFAATGLALLSFLGAGYTHREGKYKDEVYRGLMFLMDTMKSGPSDNLDLRMPGQFSSPVSKHQMYEQGIATLALCEAYQMTQDKLLEKSCQRAIDFVMAAQHYDGSWGYYPKTPGDLSIVGWQMMSLKSAHSSELGVNNVQIRWIDNFLNSQQSDGGARYGYRGTRPTASMTSIGLLMRLYRGHPSSDPRMLLGAAYVAENGPSRTDVYLNYYATQLLFQLNAPFWPKWNAKLRDYLILTQNQRGHEAGSWYFEDDSPPPSNAVGGRLYCTTLAAMTLEIYYRYMPIYQDVNEHPFEF